MSILKRSKSTVLGLVDHLALINNNIGVLSTLETEAKSSLVAAVNEVAALAAEEVDLSGYVQIDNNLSEVDAEVARENLDVLSTQEIQDAIELAQLAMGTNFTVADLTERDGLANLDAADRVLVKDDGDGKWAIYSPEAVVEGVVTEWVKLYDQDALENSISGPAIKEAYESNEDTNAFTDAEKAKLLVALVAEDIATALDESATDEAVASAAAVVSYVDAAIDAMGPGLAIALEGLVVADGAITLTNAPVNGVQGVMNFGTVRYMDGDAAFDAPVVATAEPNVFNVSTDTANQWDGHTVQIQYLYAPVTEAE